MRISDWSSYVCSADLEPRDRPRRRDRRARQYLERHLGDRAQPAPATRRELGQIVAGDLLDDLRPRDKHLATTGDRAPAETMVACPPARQPQRARQALRPPTRKSARWGKRG